MGGTNKMIMNDYGCVSITLKTPLNYICLFVNLVSPKTKIKIVIRTSLVYHAS